MSPERIKGPAGWGLSLLVMSVGAFLIAASLGWIELGTPVRRRAVFDDPRHWQLTAFGLVFFCGGLLTALHERPGPFARFNLMVLVVSALAGIAGTFWYASGGRRMQKGGGMDGFLDAIAAWFRSFGVHPVLGAFIAGALIAFVFAYRKSPSTGMSPEPGARPARGMVETHATVVGGTTLDVEVNGRRIEVPPAVIEHARAGRAIEAIKALREAGGLDLADAKRIVDTLSKSLNR